MSDKYSISDLVGELRSLIKANQYEDPIPHITAQEELRNILIHLPFVSNPPKQAKHDLDKEKPLRRVLAKITYHLISYLIARDAIDVNHIPLSRLKSAPNLVDTFISKLIYNVGKIEHFSFEISVGEKDDYENELDLIDAFGRVAMSYLFSYIISHLKDLRRFYKSFKTYHSEIS